MLSNLLTVTGQVATLFLMMAVGFVLGRAGKMTEAGRSQIHCDTPPFLVASFPMITKKVRLVNRKLKTFRKPCKTPENPFFTLRVLLCDCEVFIEK